MNWNAEMIPMDMTINLSVIIQTLVIGGGGIATVATLKNTVRTLKHDMIASKKETKEDIQGIQTEIKKLSEIVTKQATTETRLDAMDTRMTGLDKDIRELRHGEGFVRGNRGIEREYPG